VALVQQLDRDALQRACYSIARETMWTREPVDVDRIQAISDSFFKHALDLEKFVADMGRDPNIIVRCAEYLARVHAIPPMRDDTRWFIDMFDALMEVAVPNSGGTRDSERFFQDLEEGIATSRADYGVGARS